MVYENYLGQLWRQPSRAMLQIFISQKAPPVMRINRGLVFLTKEKSLNAEETEGI